MSAPTIASLEFGEALVRERRLPDFTERKLAHMRRVTLAGIAVLGILALAGCSASTKLTSVWAEPNFQTNSIKKIMVLGVAQKPAVRRMFEDEFVAALSSLGATAVQSYTVLGDGQVDSVTANAALHSGGFDGIFVTRMTDKQTVDTYYPPTSTYVAAPSAYYGGWSGYYSTGYAYQSSPGYTVQNTVVNVETNLYRLSDGKLAWSALSQSWLEQAADPSTEIRPFIQQLMYGLEGSKILSKSKK